ncbi:MAG: protease HtpX [Halioglobus sp.]|nr:protease HtpX [Halioglobus sp.]
MKRIILFLATNFAIFIVLGVVLSIVMPVLGIDDQSYGGLLLMCAVFGMGGSFISLAMSKWIAKRSVGAAVIEQPTNQQETWLLDTVKRQANQARIGMPEVAVWDSPEINAFATGMNKNNALVAVSTGLLRTMTRDEAEAVLAHEISHVANGDMVTLALIQGVVNTFVYFFARIAASALSRGSNNQFMYFMTVMFFQFVFGILASIIVMWFSRRREYRADEGGANLAGDEKMIAALQRLKGDSQESHLDGQLVAFGISGKRAMAALFLSHPPLEKRIAALQAR